MSTKPRNHLTSGLAALVFFGSVAASAPGCYKSDFERATREGQELRSQLADRTGERDRIRAELDALTARANEMQTRLGALTGEREQLQQQGAQTANELRDAQAREAELRRRQQAQEARLATYRNMIQQFRSMISAGQLRVRVVRGRMVIELPAGILFDSGRAELKPEGQQVLTQVATVLTQIRNRDFLVAGHTDNQRITRGGRYEDNWDLSAARSATVVRFLAQNHVPTDHLGAAGYAEFQPALANDTEEHRAQNRRVEIVLMPNIDELPDLSSVDNPAPATPAPATPAH